jgi:hypothetical protein
MIRTKDEVGEIIVKAGVDGGDITLLGIRTANGWRFRMVTEECDLTDEGLGGGRRESGWAFSWDAALALLDEHPWHHFHPLTVHPDFKQPVQEAVEDRLNASNLERWRRLCSAGDA